MNLWKHFNANNGPMFFGNIVLYKVNFGQRSRNVQSLMNEKLCDLSCYCLSLHVAEGID